MPLEFRRLLWVPRDVFWGARVSGAIFVAFITLMVIGELLAPSGTKPTTREFFLLLLFPFGVCVGYVVRWRWQLVGGLTSLACLAGFFVAMELDRDLIPVVVIFAMPSVLFVLLSILNRGRTPQPARSM